MGSLTINSDLCAANFSIASYLFILSHIARDLYTNIFKHSWYEYIINEPVLFYTHVRILYKVPFLADALITEVIGRIIAIWIIRANRIAAIRTKLRHYRFLLCASLTETR